ncbi:MAG: tRNA (adenosine(37)-N6)-threonylcarbamoyltransferase complex ATPase subunit type 1 TsaE [Planctomycetota bacterium]
MSAADEFWQVVIELRDDPAATEQIGAKLGASLQPGDTLALAGQLGAGKTTLVRGLARGLDLDDPAEVHSPTYLLVVEHDGPVPLRHADAYLPEKLESFLEDGGLEYLFDAAFVVAIEWADNVRKMLPEDVLWVRLEAGEKPGRRLLLEGRTTGRFAFLRNWPTILERD